MLTLAIGADRTGASTQILVIGRSENVLTELVAILRAKGHAAGATNDFDHTLDLFDPGKVDLVVFGGMVPSGVKEHLREQISTRNPAVTFVQGYAGIPGLVGEQVEGALHHDTTERDTSVTYDAGSRSMNITLDAPHHVTVTAWWHTSFVPPEPKSTSQPLLDDDLPGGEHTITIPDEVPTQASFVTVSTTQSVHTFIVGPMPTGTTLAAFSDPSGT